MLTFLSFLVLDFFESDDQDSDLGPPQNVLQLESQQKWEVSECPSFALVRIDKLIIML